LVDTVEQHVFHMVLLALAISVRIIDTVIDDPELIDRWIDVYTCHHANPFDHLMGIASVLASDQLDAFDEVLVEHGVIKHEKTV